MFHNFTLLLLKPFFCRFGRMVWVIFMLNCNFLFLSIYLDKFPKKKNQTKSDHSMQLPPPCLNVWVKCTLLCIFWNSRQKFNLFLETFGIFFALFCWAWMFFFIEKKKKKLSYSCLTTHLTNSIEDSLQNSQTANIFCSNIASDLLSSESYIKDEKKIKEISKMYQNFLCISKPQQWEVTIKLLAHLELEISRRVRCERPSQVCAPSCWTCSGLV